MPILVTKETSCDFEKTIDIVVIQNHTFSRLPKVKPNSHNNYQNCQEVVSAKIADFIEW
jgi:hypothetical protein